MTAHIDEQRFNELGKPVGPPPTEEELEHIADCEECGERAFDKLFPPHGFRKPTPPREQREE